MLGILAIAVAAGLAALWELSPKSAVPARFDLSECRHLEFADPRTGEPVVGVEDLALALDGETLILSAHDRRDPAAPDGGLYALLLASVGDDGKVPVLRLDALREDGLRFRPHGIAVDPDSGTLAVINRHADGVARVEVGQVGPGGWRPDWAIDADRLCRANDLDFGAEGLFVTLDRSDCGMSLRDLLPGLGTGAVARLTPDAVLFELSGLSFPNGISAGAVAETRAHAIRWPNGNRLDLSGGPDNLSLDERGGLIAAIHPSLARLFLMREGVFETAASRIIRITAGGGDIEILFDDPTGRTFSAATVGVMAGDRLVIGSATDSGVLLCEPPR